MNIHEKNKDTTINDLEKDCKEHPEIENVEVLLSRQAHTKTNQINKMKELYDSGDYVAYYLGNTAHWYKSDQDGKQFRVGKYDNKLIHKQNEQIADYLLKFPNSKTKLEYSLHDFKDEKISGTVDADFFFNTYQSEKFYKYRLKEQTPTNNTQVQEDKVDDEDKAQEQLDISFYKDLKNGDLLYSCAEISISELQEDLKTLPQNQRVKVFVNVIVKPKEEIQFPALIIWDDGKFDILQDQQTYDERIQYATGFTIATLEQHKAVFYQGKV